MRTSMFLRALVLAAAVSAPLGQVALAGQQEQQAATSQQNAATSSSYGNLYNDQQTAPAVGD